jgi:histidine triad (HIT) family protein
LRRLLVAVSTKDRVNVTSRRPQAPTHILVIPKEHIRHIGELSPQHGSLLAEMLGAAADLAEKEGIADAGYRVVNQRRAGSGSERLPPSFPCPGRP